MSVQPPDPPGIRISDADRERAAVRLQQAMAEGRITLSELEDRLAVVYAARYEGELRPPLADLPGDAAVVPVTSAPPEGKPLTLKAGMSTLKRTGDWDVPARLRLQSGMGTIVLDFCDTVVRHPVVDVEVEVGAGTVRLLVPDDATADIDGVTSNLGGTIRSKVPARQRNGAVHFVVHGRAGMGTLVVRRRYQLGNLRF